jgi:hypothetical protein
MGVGGEKLMSHKKVPRRLDIVYLPSNCLVFAVRMSLLGPVN